MSGTNPQGKNTPIGAASGNSFATRAINVTVQLGEGSFGESGFNTIKVSNLRTTVSINVAGMPGSSTASVIIFGLTQDVMNQLSTLGVPLPMGRLNNVLIEAGDSGAGMSVVYQGTILHAWQDLDGAPEVSFTIESVASFFAAMQPAPPISFPGGADVATIISGIATRIGRAFQNSGVQVQLNNPYFPGTPLEQAQSCARQANIEFFDDGQTWHIWPRNGSRTITPSSTINELGQPAGASSIDQTSVGPLISPASGMIGYPRYTAQGMAFRTLFNPSIQFGSSIVMQSSVSRANGTWFVNGLVLNLAAQVPGGPWFCDVRCVRAPGTPAT